MSNIPMPDSTIVGNLPVGYPAYLGYADGEFATAAELAGRFPDALRVILTVTGRTIDCDGADSEREDLTAAGAAAWASRKLAADPGSRPVIYASVVGEPGYGMRSVLTELASRRIRRGEVRLLSAHYGAGEHICGPSTCELISVAMDGTQWTDTFRSGNDDIDMSALAPDFFSHATETEKIVQQLGIARQGDTGEKVKTVQALCNARDKPNGAAPLVIDGVFGTETRAAVVWYQRAARIPADGVVGPQTWPVLLGIA